MSDKLNADIYNISEYVHNLKKQHFPVPEDTLLISTLGYLNSIMSKQIQNDIIISSERSNEIFPIKAKFEDSILTYAAMSDVKDINAIPAKMPCTIGILENDLLRNMVGNKFVLDKDTKIMVENFEFHLDYDLEIVRNTTANGSNTYTAKYIILEKNELSDIDQPYLLPPNRIMENSDMFIFVVAHIRQVEFQYHYMNINSTSTIENKNFEFSYEGQLAHFDILVNTSEGKQFIINPLFDGTIIEDEDKYHCYYTYEMNNVIRVKFILSSYNPQLNDYITVRIKTTRGKEGVFKYTKDVFFTPESKKYSYNSLLMVMHPIGESEEGYDKKTIDELKKIIPREYLARGSISTDTDLENYFNNLNTEYNRLWFDKKSYNQFENIRYAYLLLKDNNLNVIPTNTVNLKMNLNDFDVISDDNNDGTGDKYIIKPGTVFKYNSNTEYCTKDITEYTEEELNEIEKTEFLYTSPFMISINKRPLSVSYYLNTFSRKYYTNFDWINEASFVQFSVNTCTMKRQLLRDKDKYKFNFTMIQNTREDRGIIEKDDQGNFILDENDHIKHNLKVFCVFHGEDNSPIRYTEAKLVNYDEENKNFDMEVQLTTDDTININSNIKITNLKEVVTGNDLYAYLQNKCNMTIYVLAKVEAEYGRGDYVDKIIPGLDGYTLCNTYSLKNGLDFYINFSDIVSSIVKLNIEDDELDPENKILYYTLKSVPMLRYSYYLSESRVEYFINQLYTKKIYIDHALTLIEGLSGIDFKLFNTYGPSRVFRVGYDKSNLNRTNLTLNFRMKFFMGADENLKDYVVSYIKLYVENLNNISDLHVSNLITSVKNKYPDVEYIEFLGINNYGPVMQYIIKQEPENEFYVPEFLNINLNQLTMEPDINISSI